MIGSTLFLPEVETWVIFKSISSKGFCKSYFAPLLTLYCYNYDFFYPSLWHLPEMHPQCARYWTEYYAMMQVLQETERYFQNSFVSTSPEYQKQKQKLPSNVNGR